MLKKTGVEIHRDHARDARRADQISHQLRRDRRARRGLAVLSRVAVVGHDGGDGAGGGSLQRVAHDEQLHQVVVHRRTGRLHDVDVGAAHVLLDLREALTIREASDAATPQA